MPKSKQKLHGFLELSAGQDPIVDIVAIHGLDGHREHSWTADDGTMWLRDLLPDDIPNARILTYGYDTDTKNFSTTSRQTIFRHAGAFTEDLSFLRRATDPADPKRPMIFLAHSLGGIILEKALVICQDDDSETEGGLRDIVVSTFAILFFGTPHPGANGVELAKWMGRVLSVCMSTNDRTLRGLNRESSELEKIQSLYLTASKRVNTIFFYEEYPTPIVKGVSQMIAPSHSAVVQEDSKAKVVVLRADHCQMVKYTKQGDVNYRKVVGYLSELVKDATVVVEETRISENGNRGVANKEIASSLHPIPSKSGIRVSKSYVQRQKLYDSITEKLLPPLPSEHQRRCILHGLGGGGKTQAASFWIEKNKDKFGRIVVVDASSKQRIEADLETAVRSIGSQYDKATWADAVTCLFNEKGWLLFFDNANDPDLSLDEYLPNSRHGAILITTRNRDYTGYTPDSHIQVDKMSENEAINLLHNVTNITPPSNDVSLAIVKELGSWALAIVQAGAYIFRTRRLDTYLDTFQKHRVKLIREALRHGRNYQGSTYTAFDLSFGLLPRNAQDLMKVCAFLHYSLIPRALFKRSTVSGFTTNTVCDSFPPPTSDEGNISTLGEILGSTWDDSTFQTLIDSISQGLLMEPFIDNNGEYFYNIQPLVQTYIRGLLEQDDSNRHACLAGQLLLGAIRPLEDKNNSWHRQLLSHVDNLGMDVKLCCASHALAFLMIYESTGNWNAMRALMEYCYSEFKSALGVRHPHTVAMMHDFASTLYDCGQLEEAERMQRELLAMQKDMLGERHPNTILAMQNLALTLEDYDQMEEAERVQKEVLALRQETLGLHHSDTMTTMNSLALILHERGQLEEAERMQREVLALQREILGQHHPHTISTIHNLASTLRERGQLEGSEIMQREVLASDKETLGPRHPDTISTMHTLALTLQDRGQLEEAEIMQREVLALDKETLGPRHPDTVTAMHALALTLHERGQLEEAERMQRYVLSLRNEILGQLHPHTIATMHNLASTLHTRGQLEEAERMQREVLASEEEALGPYHPNTITAIHNLASTLHTRGQLAETERMLKEVLALQNEILGQRHPHTTTTMHNLALTLRDRGQLDEAERMEREVVALQSEILGRRHPHTIATMHTLASTLRDRGQLEEAERMQREALALRIEIMGRHHPHTISTMHTLALTLQERGQLEEAERIQRQVLALRNEIFGERHPKTISAMHALASTLHTHGQLEEAERMQWEVLALRNEILGRRHPHTVSAMHNLASTLHTRGQLEDVEVMQKEVLALRKEILGRRHPDTISTMHTLASTLWDLGQCEEAENMILEVMELRKEILGTQHPRTISAMRDISFIRVQPEKLAGTADRSSAL